MAVDNLDKITFLNALEQELENLPRNERDKVMYEYEQYFLNKKTMGKMNTKSLSFRIAKADW